MKQREERAQGPSEEHYIIAVADGSGEGLLVGIEAGEDPVEEG